MGSTPRHIVAIGSSTGGTKALRILFDRMPVLRASFVLVQHMPAFINESVRKSLDGLTAMEVAIARHGDPLQEGRVLIAPSEVHLTVRDNRTVRLVQGPTVNFVRPAADVLMKSLVRRHGVALTGIVMTGMGKDGAAGIRHLKRLGGTTLAQNEESSAIFGMPKAAIDTGYVDHILPPARLRSFLIEAAGVSDRRVPA